MEVSAVDVHVVADLAPVETRGLGGDQYAADNDDDEKNSARADAAGGQPVALGLLVLDQLNDAPEDQQKGPVVSEPGSKARPGKHVEIAQEKDDSQNDQDERSGKGAAVPGRGSRGWHLRLERARHCAPPRKAMRARDRPPEAALRRGACREEAGRCVRPRKR